MADDDLAAAQSRHPSAARAVSALAQIADDVPRGPWHHERDPVETGGGLVLYDATGEPLALIYAGLPLANYLEHCAPVLLLADDTEQQP